MCNKITHETFICCLYRELHICDVDLINYVHVKTHLKGKTQLEGPTRVLGMFVPPPVYLCSFPCIFLGNGFGPIALELAPL